jgi:hypothetical protein
MTNSIFSYNTYVHQNTKHFLLNKIRTQFSLTFSMLPNIIRNLRFELCKLNKILRCHFTSLTKLIPKTCVAIYFPNNIKRQSHTTTIYYLQSSLQSLCFNSCAVIAHMHVRSVLYVACAGK